MVSPIFESAHTSSSHSDSDSNSDSNSDADSDADVFTGGEADLLWVQVSLPNGDSALETLISQY